MPSNNAYLSKNGINLEEYLYNKNNCILLSRWETQRDSPKETIWLSYKLGWFKNV